MKSRLVAWVILPTLFCLVQSTCDTATGICTLPKYNGTCLNFTTYCGSCSQVVINSNINYTSCPIALSGYTNVSINNATDCTSLSIQNTANVLITSGMTITGDMFIQYTNNLTIASLSAIIFIDFQVNGTICFFGNYSTNPPLTTLRSIFNSNQFVVFTFGMVVMETTDILTTNIYCTESWLPNSNPIIQPLLLFQYNNESITLTASANLNNSMNISLLMTNFSTLILTNQTLAMLGTLIQTSTFGSVSNQLEMNQKTMINASAQGCLSSQGAGRGLNIMTSQNCSNSGASSSGYGGYGTNSSLCVQSIQFFQFILHSFPYGILEQPFVSGSSGSNPNSQCSGLAAGGGIIIIQNANTAIVDGYLTVSGGSSNSTSCSAGSAGSINFFSGSLSGSGTVNATGGSAYFNDNGEGAGGLIKLLSFNTTFGGGSIQINPGFRSYPVSYPADYGTLYTSNCPPGYGSVFNYSAISINCFPCPAGYYKGLLDVNCVQCPQTDDRPQINYSTTGSALVSQCYVNIDQRINNISLITTTREITFQRIVIFISMAIIFAIIGIVLQKKYKKKKNRLQTESFDFEKATQDINNSKIITENLKKQKDFKMADLMYHIHRISVFGTNIYDNPWILSENPPEQLQGVIMARPYEQFAKSLNSLSKWKKIQKYLLYASFIIYPIYWVLLIYYKKQKYKKIVKYIETANLNFINPDIHEDRTLIKMKVSKNTDYTICYIDLFKYNKADLKYFMLSCPYIVYLSGQGNFIRPFYLCQTDPFLNVLYFIVNRDIEKGYEEVMERFRLMGNLVNLKKRLENSSKLFKFVREFNRSSCTLDLDSPVSNFIHSLSMLIQMLQEWNKEFFNKFSVHIDLLLITSKFDGNRIIDHQVSILQRTKTEQFEQYIAKAIDELNEVDKYDIKFAIFIYNPNQDLQEFHRQTEKAALGESLMIEKTIRDSARDSIDEGLLSDEEDNTKKPSKILLKLNRIVGFFRYNLISHKASKTSKYVLKFFQIILILFDASFVAVWQSWLTYPYVGIDILAPFIGIIWITSGNSYGVGKVFLIFNAMAFFNEVVEIIIMFANWTTTNWVYKILRIVTLALQIGIIAVGCRMITYSKKLNQPKIA